MIDSIGTFIEENQIISGIIFIIIGLVVLLFRLNENNSFKMKNHGYISWKLLVQSWGLIIMFILMGIILIIKSL